MSNDAITKWTGLTVSGTLPIGVYYAGQRHRNFILRVGLAGDVIEALEGQPTASTARIALDLYRRQLLQLGDIPAEALTLDLLKAELAEIDQSELERASAELTKKLQPASASSPTGDVSSTSSSGTATA
ncbi:hypothetical protein [Stenotrophomonas sp. B1-1]|uniref:hypothetical protein n=1 Tax=Stenotrophomonas sp. B1-1 TaxID=2710648 RepID=UPI0013DBE2B8|nr:hypothetical protein [Stenotrophomonas sp. B1-1]